MMMMMHSARLASVATRTTLRGGRIALTTKVYGHTSTVHASYRLLSNTRPLIHQLSNSITRHQDCSCCSLWNQSPWSGTVLPSKLGIQSANARWKSTHVPPQKSQTPNLSGSISAGENKQVGTDQGLDDTPEERGGTAKPQTALPDLRYGIPSTFEQEYTKDGDHSRAEDSIDTAASTEQRASGSASGQAVGPGTSGGGSRGDGEIPKSAYESSIDKRRNRMAQYFFVFFALFGTTGAVYLGRNWETEAEAKQFSGAPSGWGLDAFYKRIQARVKSQLGYYTEPAFPKLLPVINDQPMPPYTLVLSLEDLLVHSEWTREHGWRTAKRPGLDFFLLYLSQYYEICLFTSVTSGVADPVYRKLDPYHLIQWPLFREATRYEDGKYIKDLSYLNRPIEKTILVDTDPSHASAQPQNAVIMPKWNGDPADRDLIALIPFLEYIAVIGIEDVRKPIASFAGTHVPTEFAVREARMREQYFKDTAASQSSKKSGGGALRSLADRVVKPTSGYSSDQQSSPSLVEATAQGKTLFDVMREEGMKRYRVMEKEIKENGHKWLRDEAELMQRMEAEQMRRMKSNPLSLLGIGAPVQQIDPQEVMAQLAKEKLDKEQQERQALQAQQR